MGIGTRIGKLCEARKMSLRKLSIQAKVPYSTLYSAVQRDSDGIDSNTLQRIAHALGVTPNVLLDANIDVVEAAKKTDAAGEAFIKEVSDLTDEAFQASKDGKDFDFEEKLRDILEKYRPMLSGSSSIDSTSDK